MNYYINEYSLRGQFQSIDDFFSSFRRCTLPVLRKIEEDNANVIIKKDTFWASKICGEIALNAIPIKKNERTAEKATLQVKLMKLMGSNPFWSEDVATDVNVLQYSFDVQYRANFSKENCFKRAIHEDGRLLSFEHDEYKESKLNLIVGHEENSCECTLDNIFESNWWKSAPDIKTWLINELYKVEVRANELSYHPPHFHVSCTHFDAVYSINAGEFYKCGSGKLPVGVNKEIVEWYHENHAELKDAWEKLHTPIFT